MEKQTIGLRFPVILLERIDAFKSERGFSTRTQAIFYLINYALDRLSAESNSKW